MTRTTLLSLTLSMLVFVVTGLAQDSPLVFQAVSGPQLATANGTPGAARPGLVALNYDGRVLMVDNSITANQKLYLVAVNDPSNPGFAKITDTSALRAVVDGANGDQPAPTNMTIAGIAGDSVGNVFVAADGADPEKAFLFRIDASNGKVGVLSGLDGPPSSIEGLTNICVVGAKVYLALEKNFGAPSGDSIVRLPASAPSDGKTAAEVFVPESRLLTAVAPSLEIAFRSLLLRPGLSSLVTSNSATTAANDDLLEIDLATGSVAVLVRATDIEADLGVTDIGPSSITVAPDGAIYLVNQFGSPSNVPPDKSIIRVQNPSAGTGDATVFATQAQVTASPLVRDLNNNPITALGFVSGEGIVALAKYDVILSDTASRSLVRIRR